MRHTLWVCVRRLVDGDTEEKMKASLAYVRSRMRAKDHGNEFGYYPARDGEPVLLAFGMAVRVY
jgi:hypothetical protein